MVFGDPMFLSSKRCNGHGLWIISTTYSCSKVQLGQTFGGWRAVSIIQKRKGGKNHLRQLYGRFPYINQINPMKP